MKNKHKNVANKIFLKVEKLISKKGIFSILSLSSLREDKHTFFKVLTNQLTFTKSIYKKPSEI